LNIINIMWAGGVDFSSVHKVHGQVIKVGGEGLAVQHWLLSGPAELDEACSGAVRAWSIPRYALKSRGLSRLVLTLWQRRLRAALAVSGASCVLLDGIGVARVMLPVVAQLPGMRAVVLFHGQARLRARDRALIRRMPAERLQLVAVSESLAGSLEADLKAPVSALRSAFNPAEYNQQLLSRESALRVLALPEDHLVLGAVGRLVPEKGFTPLIDAFAQLANVHARVLLVIMGEGDERSRLEQHVRDLGLEGRVLLPGRHDDLSQLYRAFDWVFIPSFAEGLGLVLQESVMAGVPVIATDLPVFHEQLGDAGLYVAAGDCGEWAAAMFHAMCLDRTQVAKLQGDVLGAEQAWQVFTSRCRALIGPAT